MKILPTLLLLVSSAYAQTTPNLNLNIPTPGTQVNNWGALLNQNFSSLDSYLSGGKILPSLTSCILNSSAWIGGSCASAWGGGDIGHQANTAYAALPSTGGTIYILPGITSCYDFSTPITFTTSGRYVILAGLAPASVSGGTGPTNPSGGSCLNFTLTSGTAITLDYTPANGGGYVPGNGLRDVTLTNAQCVTNGGCGSSAVGLAVGLTNAGAQLTELSNVRISGFGTGIQLSDVAGGSWGWQMTNLNLAWNTTGLSITTLHENMHWFGGTCAVNATCASISGSSTDLYMVGVSVDSNTTAGITGSPNFHCIVCHFENLGVAGAVANYVNTTGGIVDLEGGTFLDDFNTGTLAEFITTAGGLTNINGTSFFSGRTVTNIVDNTSGGGHVLGTYLTVSASLITNACSFSPSCMLMRGSNGAGPFAEGSWTFSSPLILASHLDQSATGKFAGSCAMSSGTTCTFSIASAFSSSPITVASIDAASTVPATANSAKCSVSGTTVTITAGISNSLTWDCILIGNPN